MRTTGPGATSLGVTLRSAWSRRMVWGTAAMMLSSAAMLAHGSGLAHAAAFHLSVTLSAHPADGTDVAMAIDTSAGVVNATLDDDGGLDATHGAAVDVESDDPTIQVTLTLPAGWDLASVSCAGSSQTTVEATEFTLTSTGTSACIVRVVGPRPPSSTNAPTSSADSLSPPSVSTTSAIDFGAGQAAGFGSVAVAPLTPSTPPAVPSAAADASPAVPIPASPGLTG